MVHSGLMIETVLFSTRIVRLDAEVVFASMIVSLIMRSIKLT